MNQEKKERVKSAGFLVSTSEEFLGLTETEVTELQNRIWHDAAKVGYEAYSRFTDNKNFAGGEMPKFDDLPERIMGAWVAATRAILTTYDEILGEI